MHAPITDIATLKRICLWLGLAGLLVGCAMTFEFGRAMSVWHAISLCILSIAVALMWPFVDHLWHQGSKVAAVVIGILAGAFTIAEYGSHLGYTVGHRVRDSQETGVVNASYANAQESVASEKANLALWREQLAKLKDEQAWAATVSADGLRAQLASHDKAIELETARGGCKGRCLKLMEKKAQLEEKIATAERFSDLTKRIEATQRILDKKGEVAKGAEFKSSKIVNQTRFAAQLWTASINPDGESTEWTQISIGALIALVTTFLPATCLFIAFRDAAHTRTSRPAPPASGQVGAPRPAQADSDVRSELKSLIDGLKVPSFGLNSTQASLLDLARAQGLRTA